VSQGPAKTKGPPYTRLERHIFVCINERPEGHPRGCCKRKGSDALVDLFKKELAKHGLRNRVRTNRAGCLDTCEVGPSVVVYPDGVWYCGVRPEDVAEIVASHIVGGRPVERLKTPGR